MLLLNSLFLFFLIVWILIPKYLKTKQFVYSYGLFITIETIIFFLGTST